MRLTGKIPHQLVMKEKNSEDECQDGMNESGGGPMVMHQKKTCVLDEILLELLQLHYRMTRSEYQVLLA